MLQISYEKGINIIWIDKFIKKANIILDYSNLKHKPVILYFCNNKTTKYYNSLYRNKNKETDILTWCYEEDSNIYGEIIISVEKIYTQATLNNLSPIDECCRLFVHAVAHIKGYNHYNKIKESKMLIFEKMLLSKINLNEIYN